MPFTDFSFTPSEYILLNGDQFSPETSGANKMPLLCSETLVDGSYLASLMIIAAVLANEEEGALTLQPESTKRMFGLNESTHLVMRPAGHSPSWNGYTLESAILFISSQAYAVPGDYSLQNTVFTLLAADRPQPWMKIIELVEWGLASSNWLLPVEGEAAAAFSTPFICPAKVRELAQAQPAAPVVNLLSACKKNRPEL